MLVHGRRLAAALTVALLAALVGAALALAAGEVTQKPGAAGCVSDTGSGGLCEDGRELRNAQAVAVSPDGQNVYVINGIPGGIASFDRDPLSGALVQKPGRIGCISNVGDEMNCVDGRRLLSTEKLIVSRDGRNVYVDGTGDDSLLTFDRNLLNGALTQKPGGAGCVAIDAREGCEVGRGLESSFGLAESPDGKNVYNAGWGDDALATFSRVSATGRLTQLDGTAGCSNEDGGEGCEDVRALREAAGVAVSPDGKNVYVAAHGSDAIVAFARDPATGALAQLPGSAGCIKSEGSLDDDHIDEGCELGRGLDGASFVTVSGDGKSVYATGFRAGSVLSFDRDPATGKLTQKAGEAGCLSSEPVSVLQGCKLVPATGDAEIVVTTSGRNVYVAGVLGPHAGGLTSYERDPATGLLTRVAGKPGCITEDGTNGACEVGRALDSAFGLATSPGGRNLYVSSLSSDAVAIFDRALTEDEPLEPPPDAEPRTEEPPEDAPPIPSKPGPSVTPRPPAPDTQAPTVTGFGLRPARFKAGPRVRAGFRFTLSEPATVRIVVERRRGKRFARAGVLSLPTQKAGAVTVPFRGKVGGKALAPGSYRATLVATDAAGNGSAPARTRFAVKAAAGR